MSFAWQSIITGIIILLGTALNLAIRGRKEDVPEHPEYWLPFNQLMIYLLIITMSWSLIVSGVMNLFMYKK